MVLEVEFAMDKQGLHKYTLVSLLYCMQIAVVAVKDLMQPAFQRHVFSLLKHEVNLKLLIKLHLNLSKSLITYFRKILYAQLYTRGNK